MEHIEQGCDDWWGAPLRLLGLLEPRALVHGAAYFAQAWAPRFGPMVAPVTVDVLAPGDVDACGLARRLATYDPATRWRVTVVENPVARLAKTPIVAGRGGLRAVEGRIERVFADPRARAQLDAGVMELDAAGIDNARQARRLLDLYPGLRAPTLEHEPRRVHASFDVIEHEVTAGERGGRAAALDLAGEDPRALRAIDAWHALSSTAPEMVPLPLPASLPVGDPWTATDGEFREWLLRQTLLDEEGPATGPAGPSTKSCQMAPSSNLFGPSPNLSQRERDRTTTSDPFLCAALAAQRGDQKPTHQGWETWLHAVVATLQVETDGLASDRRALRVATLLHDVGKTQNVWTPGAHPLIGAKQWSKLRPDWLPDDEAALVSFLIRTHDLLGRMDRAVTLPGFRGGTTPTNVRFELALSGRPLDEALALHRAVYSADIAAVSALRWLMPLTPLLEALVTSPVRVERRQPTLVASAGAAL